MHGLVTISDFLQKYKIVIMYLNFWPIICIYIYIHILQIIGQKFRYVCIHVCPLLGSSQSSCPTLPTVCGVVTISRGTSTAWRCWPCFEHSNTFYQTWEITMCWCEQTSCRGRGWGPGNGCFTLRWWSRYGEFWARLRWICLQLVRHRTVPSGYLWFIQLCWGWMLWYRLGRGFICTPFPDRSAHRSSQEIASGWGPSITKTLFWPGRVWFSDLISLLDSSPWGIPIKKGSPLTGRGHDLSPLLRFVKDVGVAPEGAQLIASGLSTEVAETFFQSKAPSMSTPCTPWSWDSGCGDRQLDPVNCPFGTVLEFLQARFTAGLAHSTLKV